MVSFRLCGDLMNEFTGSDNSHSVMSSVKLNAITKLMNHRMQDGPTVVQN